MKLVTIGDSITKGTFTGFGESSPMSNAFPYGNHLQKLFECDDFINYGFNGISYSKTTNINSEYSLEKKIKDYDLGDITIIAAGTNDFGTNVKLDDFERAVNYVFSYISSKAKNVYVLSPLHRFDEDSNDLGIGLKSYSDVLYFACEKYEFHFIDGFNFILNPKLQSVRDSFIFDGVHLNNEAHEILSKFLFNEIRAKVDSFEFNGYQAIVKIPTNFNGKWLWKTEFFYAFDALERELYLDGYARVYYGISDKYGSPDSIKLMFEFYKFLIQKYNFNKKGYLLGFSRGGLYAFNFALKHPECVEKMYLDAPVLDLRTWPRRSKKFGENYLYEQVLKEYHFKSKDEYLTYTHYPVDELNKYFSLNIPTLLVAGESDTTVSFNRNSNKMIKYALNNSIKNFFYCIKIGNTEEGADHHPHSFGNVGVKLIYGCYSPSKVKVYGNFIKNDLAEVENNTNIIKWFFYDK